MTFSYETAPPVARDLPDFRIRIESDQAVVEPKEHFATAEEAREVVGPVLRAWELDECLRLDDPEAFRFVYRRADIIDRDPPPGTLAPLSAEAVGQVINPVVVKRLDQYPAPPVGLVVSTEVDAMYDRFSQYKAGHVPLGPMADFCLTVLEKGGQRSAAAKKWGIDPPVLSTLGGSGGRERWTCSFEEVEGVVIRVQ